MPSAPAAAINGSVRDFVTPLAQYPHVRSTATLADVLAAVAVSREAADSFRNVLVLDGAGSLLGVLGLRDMLHALLPDYLKVASTHYEGGQGDTASLAPLWQEDCAALCRRAAAAQVGADLAPVAAAVGVDDSMAKAIYLFATQPLDVLPVVENERVLGVVRLVDVARAVAQAVRDE